MPILIGTIGNAIGLWCRENNGTNLSKSKTQKQKTNEKAVNKETIIILSKNI